uniref:Fructose-bisphosphate aldolase n=1 Tax=Globodera pallida TaxID=36090 RepID=A0A183CT64_GLOPA
GTGLYSKLEHLGLSDPQENIDNLEVKAGVPKDKLIQCHGSFGTATCVQLTRSLDAHAASRLCALLAVRLSVSGLQAQRRSEDGGAPIRSDESEYDYSPVLVS